jgi:hypothetical protein
METDLKRPNTVHTKQYTYETKMSKTSSAIFLAVGLAWAAFYSSVMAQTADNRPLIYPRYLDKKEFAKAGLWFWISEAPPTNI